MTTKDENNKKSLIESLLQTNNELTTQTNDRETESLYRFGWFYINGYKYSISAWSFQKQIVTFESENGLKVKYSIEEKKTTMNDFLRDTFFGSIIKNIRNSLSYWLKDLSDKLRT